MPDPIIIPARVILAGGEGAECRVILKLSDEHRGVTLRGGALLLEIEDQAVAARFGARLFQTISIVFDLDEPVSIRFESAEPAEPPGPTIEAEKPPAPIASPEEPPPIAPSKRRSRCTGCNRPGAEVVERDLCAKCLDEPGGKPHCVGCAKPLKIFSRGMCKICYNTWSRHYRKGFYRRQLKALVQILGHTESAERLRVTKGEITAWLDNGELPTGVPARLGNLMRRLATTAEARGVETEVSLFPDDDLPTLDDLAGAQKPGVEQ